MNECFINIYYYRSVGDIVCYKLINCLMLIWKLSIGKF